MRISSVGSSRGLTLLELLVALALAGMIMAISFPSVTAGLEGIRLQASGRRVAAFVNAARERAERDQVPVEILIEPGRNQMSALAADGNWQRTLELAEGVRISSVMPALEAGDDPETAPRRFVVIPGVPAPRWRLQLSTERGRSLAVEVDPLTGVPQIEEVSR